MSVLSPADATKLREQFQMFSGDRYGEGWEDLWSKQDFLPWDRGVPSPALIEVLREKTDVIGKPIDETDGKPQRKSALVPGCGRGVDVLLLESYGYDVVGLEYSESAVAVCKNYAEEHGSKYPVYDEKTGKGSKRYVRGDFYKNDWLSETGLGVKHFDLIYDYTFFCAMNPAMRPDWSLRMSQLLAPSPGGNLICLEFPTEKKASTGGPPFGSPPTAYMEHLSRPGEKVPYDSEGNVLSNPLLEASPNGLERVAHFHPKDGYQVGKDAQGNVRDYIAIWRHR